LTTERGLPPLLQLPAEMPSALHWRAVRALFALAGSGMPGAFAATFLTAVPCAVLERWLWLPAPLDLPVHLIAVGFVLSLGSTAKPRLTPALALGAAAGEFVGLLVPAVSPPVPGPDPVGTALRLAIIVGVCGGIGGFALNVAFARLRPALDRRFAVGFPFAALGAIVGGLLALVLLPREVPPLLAYLAFAFALGIGLLAVGVVLNTWWLYAHGFELLHAKSRAAIALSGIVIGTLLAGMHHDVLSLGVPTYLLLVASALLIASVRLPLRIAAPFIIAAYFATVASVVAWPPAGLDEAWHTDPRTVVALQFGFLFSLSCIVMHSASYTARLLFEQRLQRYARQLEIAEADHRHVSARAVREGLSQSLVGVRFALSALHSIGLPPSARRSLDDTLALLRSAERDAELAHRELGPVGLEDRGIAAVLESYLHKLSQDGAVEFELVARGPLDALSLRTRQLAFRIVTDLVGSAVRSGAGRRMRVAVEATPVELFLIVRDGGTAFADDDTLRAPESNSRLALLRERVVLEGGDLRLGAANDDDGTEIRVTLPLRRA
jgi:signal transduction histidine kinase